MVTLATLEQATAREVFDQVKAHLLSQKQTCKGEDAKCKYHSGDLRCAAGCLISEEEYKPEFEGNSWSDLVRYYNKSRAHCELIQKLQDIHDTSPVYLWEKELNELEKELSL